MAQAGAATRGPMPKRSGTRLGHTSTHEAEGAHITKAAGAERVRIPAPDKEWDKVAKDWYNSLRKSGQHRFYEPSDWAYAYFLADQMSYYQKSPKGRSSMMLTAILNGMTSLLATEGDRRRARIELERGKPKTEKTAAEIAIENYKKQLGRGAGGGSAAAA